MISRVYTAGISGIEGQVIAVETDITPGLPNMNIVGLAGTMVMESRERVKSAITNSGYEYPMRRITINLTPAGLRKSGTHYDLPIAIGILSAVRFIKNRQNEEGRIGIIGELALDGTVLKVPGVLPMVKSMIKEGLREIVLPADNIVEARLAADGETTFYGVRSLADCIDVINGKRRDGECWKEYPEFEEAPCILDFADIRGQEIAKRAITIAAAGEHGLLMIGNPGCGKTMMSKRIPGILPKMNMEEVIETSIIYSVMGQLGRHQGCITERPFRNPHHTIRRAGLIGGGRYPTPGEITFAHNGVLFLDEVCEFDRSTIEALRIPLEEKQITISRQGKHYVFPSRFMLVMAANPCKCGYYGDPDHECKCSAGDLESYRRKLSGPILERIDMQLFMEKVTYKQISTKSNHEISSDDMMKDVLRARQFAKNQGRHRTNSKLSDEEIQESAKLCREEKLFLEQAYKSFAMSPRTYFKTIRVARTIADIEESERVAIAHLSEALTYRNVVDRIHA